MGRNREDPRLGGPQVQAYREHTESNDIGVAHGIGLASLGLARLPIPTDRAAMPTRMPMPRRIYSHNVADVHIVAREA